MIIFYILTFLVLLHSSSNSNRLDPGILFDPAFDSSRQGRSQPGSGNSGSSDSYIAGPSTDPQNPRPRQRRARVAPSDLEHLRLDPLNNTPCEQQLELWIANNWVGRYPHLISQEFLQGTVNPAGPKKNLNCKCYTDNTMVCVITVRRNSFEEKVVKLRLDRSDSENLRPFYLSTAFAHLRTGPLFFESPELDPRVYAEIVVDTTPATSGNTISKSQSAPSVLNYAWEPIDIDVCTGGSSDAVCPITLNSFKVQDVVYVLKSDKQRVKEGIPVPCISSQGLRKYAAAKEDRKFVDPLKRENARPLTIKDDFDAYVICEMKQRNKQTQTNPVLIVPLPLVQEFQSSTGTQTANDPRREPHLSSSSSAETGDRTQGSPRMEPYLSRSPSSDTEGQTHGSPRMEPHLSRSPSSDTEGQTQGSPRMEPYLSRSPSSDTEDRIQSPTDEDSLFPPTPLQLFYIFCIIFFVLLHYKQTTNSYQIFTTSEYSRMV